MPYISKNAPKYKLGSMKTIIFVLIFFGLAFIGAIYFQLKREEKLENTQDSIAIIINKGKTTRGGATVYFEVNSERFESKIWGGDYSFLNIGDTILIKYAVEDPELVQVIDKYYMQKYKHLK